MIEVDIVAGQYHLLAGSLVDRFRFHRHDGFQQGQHVQCLPPAAGRFRLAQEGQRFTDVAQLAGLPVHAPGDPLDGTEQVDQHRHLKRLAVGTGDVFEHYRRSALGQQPGLDFRHLQVGRHRLGDAHQQAVLFQPVDEIPQRLIGHAWAP